MQNINVSDEQVMLQLMIVDAQNYLAEYIENNGLSTVTDNAQKRIDVMIAKLEG